MKQTRREFVRGALGWGGLLLAGSLELRAMRGAEPMCRAHRYMASRQSADGAWRSGRYAAFREGDVLTPVVLWALQASRGETGSDDAFARGLAWLRRFTDTCCSQPNPWLALRYPLFTASYAAQVLARSGDLDRAAAWVRIIERLRLSEALGWPAGDPMCGAWSDASVPPHYVLPVPDMLAPNISATALALGAISAAALSQRCQFPANTATPGTAPLQQESGARPFVERCQNFPDGEPTEFDDGGFFFALDDPIRNKAGSAGRDPRGRERFHSYGSATCDGYLALRACGMPPGHPRARAAQEWLRRNCEGLTPGGQWTAGRAEARASLAFYHGQALAAVLADAQPPGGWARKVGESLTTALIDRQGQDGGWKGTAPDSCEDEPLLASAFAIRALASLA